MSGKWDPGRQRSRKRGFILLLAVALAIGGYIPILEGARVYAGNFKLAVASISASSAATGHTAVQASDGIYASASNYWAPAAPPTAASPQSLVFDLGSMQKVGAMELWPLTGNGPKSFTILTSTDGSTYATMLTVTGNKDGHNYFEFQPLKARYVKLNVTEAYGSGGVQEIMLYPSFFSPTIDYAGTAGNMMNFSTTTSQGFDKIKATGSQVVNLFLAAQGDSGVMPSGGDLTVPGNYNFTNLDALIARFASHGLDVHLGIPGLPSSLWPDVYAQMVNEDGASSQITINFFNDDTIPKYKAFIKNVTQHYDSNPYVKMFDISGPGYYGGVEGFPGNSATDPKLYLYDNYAKAKFRTWLQAKYGSLTALNAAWDSSYASWTNVQPPLPDRGMSTDIDVRHSWSDLMYFYRDSLTAFMEPLLTEMRLWTNKPIKLETDGGFIHNPMETGASIGLTARLLANHRPGVLGDSIMDENFGTAHLPGYKRAYSLETTSDNTNLQTDKMAEDTFFNKLVNGVGSYHRVYVGSDFAAYNMSTGTWSGTDYNGNDHYTQFADRAHRLTDMVPAYDGQTETAIFNSILTSNYRKGYRNRDYMDIYNADYSPGYVTTRWTNWARYLSQPDIVDDFFIEDGYLDQYKVLILPNSGYTLTSRAAVDAIKTWVSNGGILIAFGKGSLSYTVENDRSISGGTGLSNWLAGLTGGTAAVAASGDYARIVSPKPAWMGDTFYAGQAFTYAAASDQKMALSTLASSATPVLTDTNGNALMVENAYGSGHVLFGTIPVNQSELFQDSVMGNLLGNYLDGKGIYRPVLFDADRFNVAYAGINEVTGKPLTIVANTADSTSGQSLFFSHPASFNGKEAEAFVVSPWRNVDGGVITETSLSGNEKRIDYSVSSGSELSLHSYPNSSIPVKSATANRADKPTAAKKVINGLNTEGDGWDGGPATSGDPAQITFDFGKARNVGVFDLFPETDRDPDSSIADVNFEFGAYAGMSWTATGTAFGSGPSGTPHGGVKGWRGAKWADSSVGGESATGTLRSPAFTIGKEELTFRKAGWDGSSGGSQNFYYLKRASDGAILFTAKPPQSDAFVLERWDVSAYIGQEVYFELVDGNGSSGFSWLAADDLRYSDNLDFERGNFQDWTVTGNAFMASPSSVRTNWGHVGNVQGQYFADSRALGAKENQAAIDGESRTGKLRSKTFVVEKNLLLFDKAGWDGPSGGTSNKYYLKRASDNAILMSDSPPQSDQFTTQIWNVSPYVGTAVYFEMADNNSGSGYAWMALNNIRQADNRDFATNTYTGWTTTGTAWGTGPLNTAHGGISGQHGAWWADSFTGGESATGTLRSQPFVVASSRMSFLKAGWDGHTGGSSNFFRLRRVSDDAILLSSPPPLNDAFVRQEWDVSSYVGESVYFEAVDNNSASAYAWIAIDDLEWRGEGPKSFTVSTSTDGVTFGSPVLAVTNQGNQSAQYSFPAVNARYARIQVTGGYSDIHSGLREVVWYSPYSEIPVVAATANSEQSGYGAAKAIDGISDADGNLWAPAGSPSSGSPNWIKLDLGSVQTFKAVQLFPRWNPAGHAGGLGPKDFQIQVSTDNVNWTRVYTAQNNNENAVKYHFPQQSAQYVRLVITSGWDNASQIRELKVLR
ncbi:discoidin domain-containing protein [Cohnella soli]|uniref:Discoidin domain-containing protein n=1 Tax=Cohnella soli TaxID=425005 RepID=A0ABW0HXF9_9BACL